MRCLVPAVGNLAPEWNLYGDAHEAYSVNCCGRKASEGAKVAAAGELNKRGNGVF